MEVKDKLGKYIENFDARCSIDDDLKNMLVDNFIIRLESIMNQIKEEQLWKRAIVEEFFEKGFFPMSKSNFKRGFDAFYTTIGFVGLWEAVQILTDSENSFLEDEGMELAKSILSFMADTIEGFINETHKLFNLEATPAESASYKLAKKAIKRFPDVPYRGVEKTPYFTNSCHIPVELQNRLDLIFMTQSELQTIPSGGTVTHFYTGEEMSPEEVETVVKVVCETPIPYFSVTTVYSVCPIHGYIPGAHEFCPYDHSEDDLKGIDSKYIVVDNSSATE
jgi:ribonucleoside-triphosphate reductase